MKEESERAAERSQTAPKKAPVVSFALGGLLSVLIICLISMAFYHALEEEIYRERAAYLEEISEQIVSTTDTISEAQWDLANIFANHLQESGLSNREALTERIAWAEDIYTQQGLSLLAFDTQGNYYDAQGDRARWQGSTAVISANAPERQVEITTLPTADFANDQMIFVLRMKRPVWLAETQTQLTHVAVVRDMTVFNETFQVPFFSGQGENYIVSNVGTRVYREQASNPVIGDVYNALKPLETMKFRYGGTYETLRQAVAEGKGCSLEFSAPGGSRYYVTCSPMSTNSWSLLSVVPSDVVSAGMQRFMTITFVGMGAIALIVLAAVSVMLYLVVRFRAGQERIRQQTQVNEALREAAQAAQEASRAKSVFLSHMSHDIRTPINGIMGMADIATRNRGDEGRVTDCLEKITSASHHLLGLVNDVLDMSRIESGKVQLADKPFHVEALLDGCYSVVAGQASERQLCLRRDFSGVTQQLLRGDELHLRQILINILGNAIKFTPEGGEVSFTAADEAAAGQAALTIVIRDNGIGMSEEFQKRIFEPFSQAEDDGRSKYQGTGLGMSIVKQLLDLMGGSIELQSAPGQGSTFTVRLRLPIEDVPAAAKEAACTAADLAGLRVLLVEDNELNMEIAQFVLEECGVRVTPAWNGKEAVELFVNGPQHGFDVILMDVMMPVMDGLQAARAIRASGKSDAGTVPIVAMTANAYEEDRRAALEAGMNRHLAKPLEREELIRALCELSGGKPAAASAP